MGIRSGRAIGGRSSSGAPGGSSSLVAMTAGAVGATGSGGAVATTEGAGDIVDDATGGVASISGTGVGSRSGTAGIAGMDAMAAGPTGEAGDVGAGGVIAAGAAGATAAGGSPIPSSRRRAGSFRTAAARSSVLASPKRRAPASGATTSTIPSPGTWTSSGLVAELLKHLLEDAAKIVLCDRRRRWSGRSCIRQGRSAGGSRCPVRLAVAERERLRVAVEDEPFPGRPVALHYADLERARGPHDRRLLPHGLHPRGAALPSDAHELLEREGGRSELGLGATLHIEAKDAPLPLRKIARLNRPSARRSGPRAD
jgi:hypothetical protein